LELKMAIQGEYQVKGLGVLALVAGPIITMAVPATAAAIFTPPALAPGSPYRIVFVTSGSRDALSSVIGDYNTFVNNAANAGGSLLQPLGATWNAIGSTDAVSAATNIGGVSAVPIYLLNGTFIASGTADLFDGSIAAFINIDELGNTYSGHVWTGSNPDGTQDTFGNTLGHGNLAYMGGQALDSVWIHFNTQTNNNALGFYGISSTLTVPAAQGVPEPGTITMMVAGAFLMAGAKRYQRLQRARGTASSPCASMALISSGVVPTFSSWSGMAAPVVPTN
jgi:hypothetical protein